FLATVLSVIAVGILLIAYGLLGPRAAAAPAGMIQYDARGDAYQLARPVSERLELASDPYAPYAARTAMVYPANAVRAVDAYGYSAPRRVLASPAPRRTAGRIDRE